MVSAPVAARAGVVVVDLQYGFTDPACTVGGELGDVLAATARLLSVGRARDVPIAFTAVAFHLDTLVVTGCVTSGCVRATVVDSVSWGFRTIVPLECVGDRAEGPHSWNLFDMDAKYADVEPLDNVIASLERSEGVAAAVSSS